MKQLKGVILDVDGTLVDSNDAHTHAWIEALAEQGIKVEFSKVRKCIGMGGDKLLPAVSGIEEDSKLARLISKRRGQIFKTCYLSKLQPCKGAYDLLQRMHDDGLKLVVASSAKEEELVPLLRICGGSNLIEAKTSSDDAENSKPDPDIVHAAVANLNLPREAIVMLGDTPYDLEAAEKAGVRAMALRCGGWQDSDLSRASEIYDDPANLLENYAASLLAR